MADVLFKQKCKSETMLNKKKLGFEWVICLHITLESELPVSPFSWLFCWRQRLTMHGPYYLLLLW